MYYTTGPIVLLDSQELIWPFFTQISGRNFLPELCEEVLCAVPFALQNRALFEGENRGKRCQEKGWRGVASRGGKKGKKREVWKQVSNYVIWVWELRSLLVNSPRKMENHNPRNLHGTSLLLLPCMLTTIAMLFLWKCLAMARRIRSFKPTLTDQVLSIMVSFLPPFRMQANLEIHKRCNCKTAWQSQNRQSRHPV